jgi:hypothetical protein
MGICRKTRGRTKRIIRRQLDDELDIAPEPEKSAVGTVSHNWKESTWIMLVWIKI